MATSTRKPAAPRKTTARPSRARATPKTAAKPAAPAVKRTAPAKPAAAPNPLGAWRGIAKLLVDKAVAEPTVKKKIRAKQLREHSARLWEERFFSKHSSKGKKKILKATRDWIDGLLEATETVTEKITPKSNPKGKPAKPAKGKAKPAKAASK